MIKIVNASYRPPYKIYCEFSDRFCGEYNLESLLFRYDTPLTMPLRNEKRFSQFFLRSGAICWKNGLELDPQAIYQELHNTGL